MARVIGATFFAAVVALLAVSASMGGTSSTVVRGVVVRSPITPVCIEGRPCAAPLASATVVFSRGGVETARVTTSRRGRFSVRLAPGAYGVRLLPKSRLTMLSPRGVRVPSSGPVWLRLVVDTSIRLPGPRILD